MMTNDQFRERLRPIERSVSHLLTRVMEWSVFIGVAGTYPFEDRMEAVEKVLNEVEFRRKINVQFIVPATSGSGILFGPYEEHEANRVAFELNSHAIPLEYHPVPKEQDDYEYSK